MEEVDDLALLSETLTSSLEHPPTSRTSKNPIAPYLNGGLFRLPVEISCGFFIQKAIFSERRV
jgi:hypothetical protein